MFHRPPPKKPKPRIANRQRDLMAVITADELLTDAKRHSLAQKIHEFSGQDESSFDVLYTELIQTIAGYYQLLPESAYLYYASAGGLLDHALNRTEAAVSLFHQNFLPEEQQTPSDEQKRWIYALFSASLLRGIGKLQTDYKVNLFDNHRRLLNGWNPLLSPLSLNSCYYDYVFQQHHDEPLKRRLTTIMAHQLMPKQGFEWIAKHPRVLATWLSLLHEDHDDFDQLHRILERADAIAMQRALTTIDPMQNGLEKNNRATIGTFMDATPASMLEQERLIGAAFIQWLMEALKNGRFIMNQSPLLITSKGLLAESSVFQAFLRENSTYKADYKTEQALQKGLLRWGLHQPEQLGEAAKAMHTTIRSKGMLLNQYGMVLPDSFNVYHAKTNQTIRTTALEWLQMQTRFPLSDAKPSAAESNQPVSSLPTLTRHE